MIRILDLIISLISFIMTFPLLILIYLIIKLNHQSPLFFQERLGRYQKIFTIIKFRTMKTQTKSVATHLVNPSNVTSIGKFLRKTKLDELPQLLNVIKGDMSLVGPRPCLPSQKELIKKRSKNDIFEFRPGITGLSQIKGIDMSNPKLLTNNDLAMIKNFNIRAYFYYILMTIIGLGRGDKIKFKQ